MDATEPPGEVTLIEAIGRGLAWAGVKALRRASVVLADPRVHPNVLWHAPASADIVLQAWDTDLAHTARARSEAGASVVCLVESLDIAPDLRASGVELRRVPGVEVDEPRGPLGGRRILVTRPRDSALAQRERFDALGADAVALPCLQIGPPDDLTAFDAVVAEVEGFDGLIVSSRAGVAALGASLHRSGLDVRALAGTMIVAVGRATASACEAFGIRPDIVPSRPRSEGIVDALDQRGLLGQRWLHVRARDGRATVDDAITRAGGRYRLAIAYQAERPAPPAGVLSWLRDGVDAVCIHSGRTGTHLRTTLEDAGLGDVIESAAVVSAGPVTTETLAAQGFLVACTASSPGDDGMVNAVLERFAGS